MDAVAEHALQALGVLLLLGVALSIAILLLSDRAGLFVLFAVAGFAVPTAVGAGATLAAINFLYPRAVATDGFAGFFWLVALASLASTAVFDLGVEGLLLRFLRRLGFGMNGVKLVEAIASSFFVAAALAVTALLMAGSELSAGAAMAAGAVASFSRYFLGLYLDDKAPPDPLDAEEDGPGSGLSG